MVERSSELSAVMRRFLGALESRDEASIRALMTAGKNTLILGSDPREWYQGSVAADLLVIQGEGMPEFHYEIQRLEAFEDGAIGWAAADVISTIESHSSTALRMTAVFSLDSGVWKVVHWHTSAPQEDDPDVVSVELSETMTRLLNSLDVKADLAALRKRLETSTVTIVFTDLEDSARITAEVGDETWSDLITRHFKMIEDIAVENDGLVVKTLGDGVMMAFGSTRKAIRAAMAIKGSTDGSDSVRVRIGVNTGEAVRTGDDYFGQTVNLAARITAAAGPGEILVSEIVRSLVGETDEVTFGEARSLEFKGVEGVQTVSPVVGAARPART